MVAAHGGTLFLDEIGELPKSLQAKLLRALQDGEVTPVGGGSPIAVDVRVVAATNRDLEAMIAGGRFREDLYYRLDVVSLEIPPLRARREDIPALAEHFRREVNAREGRSVPGFALDVMQRLAHYDWPGNVRELENLVERAVVMAGKRMVVMNDLPSHIGPTSTQVLDLERATRGLADARGRPARAALGDRGAAAAIEPRRTCVQVAPEECRVAIPSAHSPSVKEVGDRHRDDGASRATAPIR